MAQIVEILPGVRTWFSWTVIAIVADVLVKQAAAVSVMVLTYCQTSIISAPNLKTWKISGLILQLSLPNPLKPGVESRMKM